MRIPILALIAAALWAILALFWVGGRKAMTMLDGASAYHPPVAVNATVERRLHLTMDDKWDTDKRRSFVCREER